ncbi:hypothetical protein FA09DRAFT_331937 [Tilletiopsis washingtonensis]|uniref:Uncharacterized protein n=1 Tax=Tilletiopsis washingtonensis TaxID=58919 RepID=A0A316Z648_9BASI|nr:hypothetical protein FA09DRAFT_331937 [Tilletiopsis washingtonensis]PWN95613.1 hypothetical protein FA09DRAFT_331937 [Tilletiopsis washingtonensis]
MSAASLDTRAQGGPTGSVEASCQLVIEHGRTALLEHREAAGAQNKQVVAQRSVGRCGGVETRQQALGEYCGEG